MISVKPQLAVIKCKIQCKEIDRTQSMVIYKNNSVLTWISTIRQTQEILWFLWVPTKVHWARVTSIFSVSMLIILQWAGTTNFPIIYQVIMFRRVVLVRIQEPLTGNQMKWWQIVRYVTTNSMCWGGSIIVDSVEMCAAIPAATWKNMYLVIKTSKSEFAYNVTKKI